MITLDGIAKKCGVSRMTVSRALSQKNNHKVSPELKEQIQRLAKEHGYRPSKLALSLSSGKTHMIGFICMNFRHFASEVFSGALEYFMPHGYDLLALEWSRLSSTGSLIKSIVDRRVEAVMVFPDQKDYSRDQLIELVNYGIPVLLVDRVLGGKKADRHFSFIGSDNFEASSLAVQHLVELGHKNISFVARKGDTQYSTFFERLQSYEKSMKKAGLKPLPLTLMDDENTPNSYSQILSTVKKNQCTGFVAANDVVASKTIMICQSGGYKIPQDISIVGMGNIASFVNSIYPPLTTVDLGASSIGRKAAEWLLGIVEQQSPGKLKMPPKTLKLSVNLKVRQSTDRCRNVKYNSI